jgi:hypothetical protein
MREAPQSGQAFARAVWRIDFMRWHGVCVLVRHVHCLRHPTMPTLTAIRRTLYSLMSARFIELQKQRHRS